MNFVLAKIILEIKLNKKKLKQQITDEMKVKFIKKIILKTNSVRGNRSRKYIITKNDLVLQYLSGQKYDRR